jgi:hypothetical protein
MASSVAINGAAHARFVEGDQHQAVGVLFADLPFRQATVHRRVTSVHVVGVI